MTSVVENNGFLRCGDLFAGGGGTTEGALQVPGVKVVWALNHSDIAIATHSANHPETVHYKEDIRVQRVEVLEPVDLLWASLECTNFSNAKGGKPRDADSRSLAWELPRYITHCTPDVIMIENVKEFMSWGPLDENGKPVSKLAGSEYVKWVEYVKEMGYPYFEWRILNSADFGAYTSRRRFFAVFSKFPYSWPSPTHFKDGINGHKWKACREKIDLSNEGNSIFGRELNEKIRKPHRRPLSANTLRRIAGGLKKFAPEMYFLMCYFGSGNNCHSLTSPAPTILSRGDGKDGMALVKAEKLQFITDHCQIDYHSELDQPLATQLTRQTKQFISATFNSNNKPEANNKSVDEPLNAVLTREKFQFISSYLENKVHELHELTQIDFDFDIKMRFLTAKELADITGFREGYEFKGNTKQVIWQIGNAVPPVLSKVMIEAAKNKAKI